MSDNQDDRSDNEQSKPVVRPAPLSGETTSTPSLEAKSVNLSDTSIQMKKAMYSRTREEGDSKSFSPPLSFKTQNNPQSNTDNDDE
jgi:hypothetical protein